MSYTQTLAIIKPDAFGSGNIGKIVAHLEAAGFTIRAARVVHLDRSAAERFYRVHAEQHFFTRLVDFMTSGPCMALALRREDAVPHLREVIGDTDPALAGEGTVRQLYAGSKERNAIHASDSPENAAIELAFFFSELDRI